MNSSTCLCDEVQGHSQKRRKGRKKWILAETVLQDGSLLTVFKWNCNLECWFLRRDESQRTLRETPTNNKNI